MTAQKSRTEKFFFVLNRCNAVGVAIVLICLVYGLASNLWYEWASDTAEPFGGNERQQVGSYSGEEIDTNDGPVAVYGIGKPEKALSDIVSPNLSLTHMASGTRRLIVPSDSTQQIIRFETVKTDMGSGKPVAFAYFALLADTSAYAKGRMDLVVGNLPQLKQVVVGRNLYAIDLPTLYGEDRLAIIIWPNPSEARLVSIDLTNLKTIGSQPIPLPRPMSTLGEPVPLRSTGERNQRPVKKFEF